MLEEQFLGYSFRCNSMYSSYPIRNDETIFGQQSFNTSQTELTSGISIHCPWLRSDIRRSVTYFEQNSIHPTLTTLLTDIIIYFLINVIQRYSFNLVWSKSGEYNTPRRWNIQKAGSTGFESNGKRQHLYQYACFHKFPVNIAYWEYASKKWNCFKENTIFKYCEKVLSQEHIFP